MALTRWCVVERVVPSGGPAEPLLLLLLLLLTTVVPSEEKIFFTVLKFGVLYKSIYFASASNDHFIV
jgi:hypothetical protein